MIDEIWVKYKNFCSERMFYVTFEWIINVFQNMNNKIYYVTGVAVIYVT